MKVYYEDPNDRTRYLWLFYPFKNNYVLTQGPQVSDLVFVSILVYSDILCLNILDH